MLSTRHDHAQTQTQARECISCWETKPRSDFFEGQPLTGCEHDNCICKHCWDEWISVSLATKYQPRLTCPMTNCDSFVFGSRDLLRLAGPKKMSRYLYVVGRINRNNVPDLNWCLNPACNAPLKAKLGGRCSLCNSDTCTDCHAPGHGVGSACEQYQCQPEVIARKEQEAMSTDLMKQMQEDGRIKACQNCACPLELEYPRKIVKCSRCRYYFDTDDSPSTATKIDTSKRPGEKQNVRFIIEQSKLPALSLDEDGMKGIIVVKEGEKEPQPQPK